MTALTFDEYCQIPAVNWSTLKHLWGGSPAHYRYARESADSGDNTGRKMGRLLHGLALGCFDEEFVLFEAGDRRGNVWKEFVAANPGKTILKPNEIAAVRAQVDAVHMHAAAHGLIVDADVEHTLTWTDPETGIACKGRLDVLDLQAGYLADLKGCGGLDLLERTCHRLGYVHQLAWYRRGARIVHGVELDAYIIGVETKAPHDVGVWRIDPDLLAMADRDLDVLMARLAECEASGVWPGRMPDVGDLFAPAWMIPDEVEIPEDGIGGGDDEQI